MKWKDKLMSDHLMKCLFKGVADTEQQQDAADRIEELESVLREVDEWVYDMGRYAPEGHIPATVFRKVREVLSSD